MKIKNKTMMPLNKGEVRPTKKQSGDFTSADNDADKTSSDNDADETVKRKKSLKSKLEVPPDSTGGDTKADKTRKEKFPFQHQKKR